MKHKSLSLLQCLILKTNNIRRKLMSHHMMTPWHENYFRIIGPSWWRHQMDTFSVLLALCAGNSPVPVNSPHKGQWRGALMFTLICAGINDWVNNREAGDLRRHLDHYDVSVMPLWGSSLLTGRLPTKKGQWNATLEFSLLLAQTNCWTNSWVGGEIRYSDADLTGMTQMKTFPLKVKQLFSLHCQYHTCWWPVAPFTNMV